MLLKIVLFALFAFFILTQVTRFRVKLWIEKKSACGNELTFSMSGLGYSKSQRISKSHIWFKSYGNFSQRADLAYSLSVFPGKILYYTMLSIQVSFPA